MEDTTELYDSCKEMLERLKALSGSLSIPQSAPFSRRQIIERAETALKNARTCRRCLEFFDGEGPVCAECLEHEENKSALHDLQERESSDGLHPGHDF